MRSVTGHLGIVWGSDAVWVGMDALGVQRAVELYINGPSDEWDLRS